MLRIVKSQFSPSRFSQVVNASSIALRGRACLLLEINGLICTYPTKVGEPFKTHEAETLHVPPPSQKILVLGGNGFVGSHIFKEVLNRGLVVASLSRITALCRRFSQLYSSLHYHSRHVIAISFSDPSPAVSEIRSPERFTHYGYTHFSTEHSIRNRSLFDRRYSFRCLDLAQSLHYSTSVNSGKSNDSADSDRKKQVLPSWIDSCLPKKIQPYAHLARLDKPIGTWLLVWPCFWSITMAATPGTLPDLKMMALFGSGALLLRGAGCTVNDLLDRDIDTKVERTRLRPVASGVLTPFQGLCFLGVQLLLGLGILVQLNPYSQILGASSLLLVFSYPLMKRLTFWPQAYLGLTFNWGALLGWAAIRGSLDPAIVIPLYFFGVFWTLVYDTIYAHQDKDDDLKVGVKSTALRFGDSSKEWLSGFGLACITSLALSGANAELGWTYYPFLAAASAQLAWQIWTVDTSSRADCNKKFVSNKWFGAIIFSGILCGRLVS